MIQDRKLIEIALLFFKLGCIAFGGPAAHIAMMEDEIVTKRKWMTQEHFMDLIGITNLIPGPNSTEMVMHCGRDRAGWKGLFVAGISFIFPAVVITGIFAWLYQKYGELPAVEPFIYGIKPAVIVIIIMAGYRLGKKAIKNIQLAILGIVVVLLSLIGGINQIVILLGSGMIGVIFFFIKNKKEGLLTILPFSYLKLFDVTGISNSGIFLTFLKIGSILYGSGYVLFAFLDTELVSMGWLTRQELLDAVAVGQLTPGPVLSTATFIGWQINDIQGALLATLGIFLPSFLFVMILTPIIPKLQKSKKIRAFLDAVNVGAVALIVAVCIQMGKETLTDWRAICIAIISIAIVIVFKKVNSLYIVIGGALIGYVLHYF